MLLYYYVSLHIPRGVPVCDMSVRLDGATKHQLACVRTAQ